jgi:hypothetical protein
VRPEGKSVKKANRKHVPKFNNEDEEREFWATHSPVDFFDMNKAIKVTLAI